jgi:hypothetical protein
LFAGSVVKFEFFIMKPTMSFAMPALFVFNLALALFAIYGRRRALGNNFAGTLTNVRRKLAFLPAILFICASVVGPQLQAEPVDNSTVLKLLDAGMTDEVILKVIASGETKFDTSKNALTELKSKGASANVIVAIITAGQAVPAQPALLSAGTQNQIDADYVASVAEAKETPLSYITPEFRTSTRALGLGGAGTYAVLNGPSAESSVSANISFVASLPRGAQPSGSITLAIFTVQEDGNREIMVENAVWGKVTSGIPKERSIPLNFEKLADQSRAKDSCVLYRITLGHPLSPGQYGIITKLDTGGFQQTGRVYDFKVN